MQGEMAVVPTGLRVLRKRRRETPERKEDDRAALVAAAASAKNIVVFSGSGLSASSGMSMFSTRGGLYEKACKRFNLSDGKHLFSWKFYAGRRADVTSFFVDIHKEARKAEPGKAQQAVASLHARDKLLRHYTMNVDGLATHTGMTVWHHERNDDGDVVELHGNVKHLVCPSCEHVAEARPGDLALLKKCLPRMCPNCHKAQLRFKIMLYDDHESDKITPENVYERLEDDCAVADLIIWVGISFEQSASVEYFRTARSFLMKHGRLESVQQAIINPCESASFNLLTAVGNAGALNVMKVLMPADDAMDAVSNAVNSESNPEKLEAIYQDLQASADEAAHDVALAEEAAFAQEATTSNSKARGNRTRSRAKSSQKTVSRRKIPAPELPAAESMPESEMSPVPEPEPEPDSPLPEWTRRRKRNCTRRSRADLSVFLWPTQEDAMPINDSITMPPAFNVVGPQLLPWRLHAPPSHHLLQPELPIAPVMPSGSLYMHAAHASSMGMVEGMPMSVSYPSATHTPPFVLQQRMHGHADASGNIHEYLPSTPALPQGLHIKTEPAATQLASALGSLEQEPLLRQLRDHLARSAAASGATGLAGSAVNAKGPAPVATEHAVGGHTAAPPIGVDQIALLERLRAGGGDLGMSVVDLCGRSGVSSDATQRAHGADIPQNAAWNASQQSQRPSAPLDSLKGALQQLQQRAGPVAQPPQQTAVPHQRQSMPDPSVSGSAAPSVFSAAAQGQLPHTSSPMAHEVQLQVQLQSQLLAALGGDKNNPDSRRDVMALVQMLKHNNEKASGTPTHAHSYGTAGAMKMPFVHNHHLPNGQQQSGVPSAQATQHAAQQHAHKRYSMDSAGSASRQLSGSGAALPAKPLSQEDTNGPVTLSSLCQPAAQVLSSPMQQLPSKDAANALLRHFGLSAPSSSAPGSATAAAAHASSAFNAAGRDLAQASSAPHTSQHTPRTPHGRQSDWGHEAAPVATFSEALVSAGNGSAAGGAVGPQFSPEHLQILQTLAAVEQQRNREAAVSVATQLATVQGGRLSLPGGDLTHSGQHAQHAAHAKIAQQLQQHHNAGAATPNAAALQQQQQDGAHMFPLLQQVINASRQAAAGTQAAVSQDDSRHNSTAAQDLISHLSQQNAAHSSIAPAAQSPAALELKNRMLQQFSQRVTQSTMPDSSSSAGPDAAHGSPQQSVPAAHRRVSTNGLDTSPIQQRHSHDGSAGGSPGSPHPSSMPPTTLSQQHMHVSRGVASQPNNNTGLHSQQQPDAAANALAGQSPAQLLSQLHEYQSATGSQPPAVSMSGSAFARAALAPPSPGGNHAQEGQQTGSEAASQLVLQMLMSQGALSGHGGAAGNQSEMLGALNDAARSILQNRERENALLQQQSRGADLAAQRLQLTAQLLHQQRQQAAATTALQNHLDQGHAQQQQQAVLVQLLQQAQQQQHQGRGIIAPGGNHPAASPRSPAPALRSPSQHSFSQQQQQQQQQAMLQLAMQHNAAAAGQGQGHGVDNQSIDRNGIGRARAGSDPGANQAGARQDTSTPRHLSQHIQQLLSKHLASSTMQNGAQAQAQALHASGNHSAGASAVNQLQSAVRSGQAHTPEEHFHRVMSASHVPLSTSQLGSLPNPNSMGAQRAISCGGAIGSGAAGYSFQSACAALQGATHAAPPASDGVVAQESEPTHAAAAEAVANVEDTSGAVGQPDSITGDHIASIEGTGELAKATTAQPDAGATVAQEEEENTDPGDDTQDADTAEKGPEDPAVSGAPQEGAVAEPAEVSEATCQPLPDQSAIDALVQSHSAWKAEAVREESAMTPCSDQKAGPALEPSEEDGAPAAVQRATSLEKQQPQPSTEMQGSGGASLQCKSRPSSADSHESAFELAVG